jgi:6-pyruvoyltetrahydropterin/6-carboxytetrahydropterin synthase
MPYRICKRFEVENAHMLLTHPEKCKFPHGHSRTVEVVLCADELDSHGMVCDFKALKHAVAAFIDSFDHAICLNSADPLLPVLRERPGARVIVYDGQDPTTEVMARHIFQSVKAAIARGEVYRTADGTPAYAIRPAVVLERVRVTETSSSWAEYWE